LNDIGVLKFNKIKFADKYGYVYPKLNELGINNPCVLKTHQPEDYFNNRIPKYILEMLYAKSVDTTPNWDEIFNLGMGLNTVQPEVPVEAIRNLVKSEFGILITGDLPELKGRVQSILRNKELSSDLPEIKDNFLLDPGTKDHPRIQYIKYMKDQSKFPVNRINLEKYFTELTVLLNDPNTGIKDVVRIAEDIGIFKYVSKSKTKDEVCQVIQKYFNIIRDERIL